MPSIRWPSEETTSAPMPFSARMPSAVADGLRAVDGGDLTALVSKQLADLHGNLLRERCRECAPARGPDGNGTPFAAYRRGVRPAATRDPFSGSGTPSAAGSPASSPRGSWPTRPGRTWIGGTSSRAVVQMLPVVVLCLVRRPGAAGLPRLGGRRRPAPRADVLDRLHDRDHRAPGRQGRVPPGDGGPRCAPSGPSASGWSAAPPTAGTAPAASIGTAHSTRKPTFSRTWK